jgi:cytochrome c2
MNQRFLLSAFIFCSILTYVACNSNSDKGSGSTDSTTNNTSNNEGVDPKGIGKFKDVKLTHPLDENMVASGKNIYELKCQSCHKLTDERIVGPGWKGVTDRRTPEWIMNFITNVDEMIAKDTAAQKMLEVCLVRMPNQNMSDDDARHVLEYMRKNDGKQ